MIAHKIARGTYWIKSRSRAGVRYIVRVSEERGLCHCPCAAFQYRGHCSHVISALQSELRRTDPAAYRRFLRKQRRNKT